MSTFNRNENVTEVRAEYQSRKGYIHSDEFINPVVAGNTNVHAAITLPTSGTTLVTTAITQPDVPRTVRIKGNAVGITGNVVVTGKDVRGKVITDTIAAADAGAVDGVKAFKEITSILVPARTTAGDTISVGFGPAFGLGRIMAGNTALLTTVDEVTDTAPTITRDSSDVSKNIMVPNTTPNGAKDFVIYFISKEIKS